MEGGFTLKEFMENTIVPRIERLQIQVDELDRMAREGSPFGNREVLRVEKEIADMKGDIDAIKKALLTPENVGTLVGESLQKTEARGWTHRERWIGVLLFVIAVITLGINLISLKLG